jgi:hypothetical protein
MVRQRAKALQKTEDTSWVPKALEKLRDLSSLGGTITAHNFAAMHVDPISENESERRLRKLTNNGWLHMAAEKTPDGTFLRYVWTLR